VGTIQDGYTTVAELSKLGHTHWKTNGHHGTARRNWLAYLLCHNCLLRGEDVRALDLANLYSITLENEGHGTCVALLMSLRQGKTNKFGRVEIGAWMRNKVVEVCPHGSLSFYLFWRWHIENEPSPQLDDNSKWFKTKV